MVKKSYTEDILCTGCHKLNTGYHNSNHEMSCVPTHLSFQSHSKNIEDQKHKDHFGQKLANLPSSLITGQQFCLPFKPKSNSGT